MQAEAALLSPGHVQPLQRTAEPEVGLGYPFAAASDKPGHRRGQQLPPPPRPDQECRSEERCAEEDGVTGADQRGERQGAGQPGKRAGGPAPERRLQEEAHGGEATERHPHRSGMARGP